MKWPLNAVSCRHRLRSSWVVFFVIFALCGCKTYREVTQSVREDYYQGDLQGALSEINELVQDNDDNKSLYLMERSIIYQRMGRFKEAQNDLMKADELLEVLDFANDTTGTIAEYTFSPDKTLYRGQPHEKILLNTLNMVNFLAEGDLSAARIEARRAGEMYSFQVEVEEQFRYKNALTMMLFGLVFDLSGRPNDAYIAYKKSFELCGAPFLRARLLHSARSIRHSDRTRWEQDFGDLPEPVPEGHGTILVIVMNGQGPVRVEKEIRVPAPCLDITHDGVEFRALGRKHIRFPELTKRSHLFRQASATVDNGAAFDLVNAVDIESQAMARFEEERPKIIAACVTRLLIRSIASGAASQAIQKAIEGKEKKKARKEGRAAQEMNPLFRSFMETLFDAGLSQFDVPDLRCWSLLPADIMAGIQAVPAGDHTVSVQLSGRGSRRLTGRVSLQPGKIAVVQFFVTE